MSEGTRLTSSAAEILHRRFFEGHPDRIAMLEQERENLRMAEEIYRLRTEAGLTQAQLAKRVGTSPSVISRLEDADYEGHSLRMLRRIAEALNCRVDVRFVPRGPSLSVAEPSSEYEPGV